MPSIADDAWVVWLVITVFLVAIIGVIIWVSMDSKRYEQNNGNG